jgi:hypothetical protein
MKGGALVQFYFQIFGEAARGWIALQQHQVIQGPPRVAKLSLGF